MRSRLTKQSLGRAGLVLLYLLATVQLVWCYLWQVRPYVNTALYEHGEERMPFQGRLLMALPMRWAHHQHWIIQISALMHSNLYWFPRPMQPEALVQAVLNLSSIAIAGWVATDIYRSASRWHLLTPLVYPLVLVLCVATYLLHTIQNFRFIYDLPSLALFAIALWLIYFRRPAWMFIAVFLIATVNRETTLLLLPIYALTQAVRHGRLEPRLLFAKRTLAVVLPLAVFWAGWQIGVRILFARNPSEFYPRIDQNLIFLISPRAWPQMLGACGYLFPIILLFRRRLVDPELRAWLWVFPVWFTFMFVYGILIETRIFGELIPYVACAAALVAEESLAARVEHVLRRERQGPMPFPAQETNRAQPLAS